MNDSQTKAVNDSFYKSMRACFRKIRFSLELAEKVAKKHDQTIYYCIRCGGYHLATKKEK